MASAMTSFFKLLSAQMEIDGWLVSLYVYVRERSQCDTIIDYDKIWCDERESETGKERIEFITVERESDL